MHKAINFDLDTKKCEIITQKTAPTAYYEHEVIVNPIGLNNIRKDNELSISKDNIEPSIDI